MDTNKLQKIANERRADAVTMITRAKTGHTGGAMSCLDALTCLFYRVMHEGDHFLLSKGHSVEGYWAILADKGCFPKADLKTFSCAGSPLIGHPNNKVPGVEMSTGALGHGLPVGVGMAIGERRQGRDSRVFVVMGDGEQAEGSVWEAAMAAAHHRLDNLVAMVDVNGIQINGWVNDIMRVEPLADKWRAFGWNVVECDGHDMRSVLVAFHKARAKRGAPTVILAATVKGKGVSYMEDNNLWHGQAPNDAQTEEAIREINQAEEGL